LSINWHKLIQFRAGRKTDFRSSLCGWVAIFDPETLKVIKEVKPAQERNPDYLLYDPGAFTLFIVGRQGGINGTRND